MKNALNNQVGMLGNMFLWLVANLKQGVIYFIKQEGGNHKIAWVYQVLQTIQMKLILLCVWAEPAVLGSAKTALKFIYKI